MHPSCVCRDCKTQNDEVCGSALQSSCKELGCDDTLSRKRNRVQKAIGITTHGHNLTKAEIKDARKPCIHFGTMASGNQVMKSGQHRDHFAAEEKVVGFEMESAGTWDSIPTIVVKGVCDYADSHKNNQWQKYAAVTAAACTRAILEEWRSLDRG
jgi:nucleoside phosphorylase